MAKVNIDVDTSKKTVTVKVDGKKVDDVRDISIFTEKSGFFGVDIAMSEDLGDLRKVTRLVANTDDPKATSSEEFDGMFEITEHDEQLINELSKALFPRRQ